jgi:MraZ protein
VGWGISLANRESPAWREPRQQMRQRQTGMEAFRGNHPAKVEDGGRLKLPGPFKKIVDEANITDFYITSMDGLSAQIWPLPAWVKQEALLGELSATGNAAEKYLDQTSYYGQQVEMDKQARVQLPQILRGTARLDGEVAIRGKINYLEVHNLKNLEEHLKTNVLTPVDRDSLSPILKPRGNQ